MVDRVWPKFGKSSTRPEMIKSGVNRTSRNQKTSFSPPLNLPEGYSCPVRLPTIFVIQTKSSLVRRLYGR